MTKYTKWVEGLGLEKIKSWKREGKTNMFIAEEIGVNLGTLYDWCGKFIELEQAIVCKGQDGVEYVKNNHTSKKNISYFKDGEEVKFCSCCNEFVNLENYISKGYKCRSCGKRSSNEYRNSEQGKRTKKEYAKKYYENNKERIYEYVYKRFETSKNLPFNFTNKDWKETLKHFNNECAYCGDKNNNLQKEHVIPVSKGGGYVKTNIVPACPSCNMSKSNRYMEEWYEKKDFFNSGRLKKIHRWVNMKNNNQQLTLL